MLTDLVKVRRQRRKLSKRTSVKQNFEGRRKTSFVYNEAYLKNKYLSIMTDKEPDFSAANYISMVKNSKIVTEDKPAIPSSKSDSLNNVKSDVGGSKKLNDALQTQCGTKYKCAWYLKFKRRVLKILRNRVSPGVVSG